MSTASGNGGRRVLHDYPSNSSIPRKVDHHPPSAVSLDAGNALRASRQKQTKRDEAIRKRLESDLNKKKYNPTKARQSRKAPPGTVLALRPSPALQIKPSTTVAEAAQMMAAKREDCVLVTDEDDRIAGIFTAKDLAFRVVGNGGRARDTLVAEIMTRNPLCARTDTSATDALDLMVKKGFRHLPVMDEKQDISGVLDITKCFYDAMQKMEKNYDTSQKLYDALEDLDTSMRSKQIIEQVEALRSRLSSPTLESVVEGVSPTTVSVRTTVKEAAAMMRENHTTALLVHDQGSITGIFTSKDVVLRVIAPGLDPATCSVPRVMTPHPDFAPMHMTIQAALRKMHDGHYLNLPVTNDTGEIVGMVDVLKLTYATLEQINSSQSSDSEGPAWNKFWLSMDQDTDSALSGGQSLSAVHEPHSSAMVSPEIGKHYDPDSSILPTDSASHHGDSIADPVSSSLPPQSQDLTPAQQQALRDDGTPFPFKFRSPGGRVHRIQVGSKDGVGALLNLVVAKLGPEVDAIGGKAELMEGVVVDGFAMSYLDNEGDTVSITADNDLADAIYLARRNGTDKVDLFVHHPDHPPVIEHVPPPPVVIPASDEGHSQDGVEAVEEKAVVPAPPAPVQTQLLPGVPNEILLPGFLATIAVSMIGVFILGRSSR